MENHNSQFFKLNVKSPKVVYEFTLEAQFINTKKAMINIWLIFLWDITKEGEIVKITGASQFFETYQKYGDDLVIRITVKKSFPEGNKKTLDFSWDGSERTCLTETMVELLLFSGPASRSFPPLTWKSEA